MHGDELRIRYVGELHKAWSGVGHVIKIPDSILWLGFAHLLLVFLILVAIPVSSVQGWSAYWLSQWYRVHKVFESLGKMGYTFQGLESL